MKKTIYIPVLLSLATFLGACTSMPTSTTLLDQTRSDYRMAQSNQMVAMYAPLEIKQASDALEKANVSAAHNESLEKIDQLAYVAKQKIALAQEVAGRRLAEANIAASAKDRDQILLNQRTNEADQARFNTEQARQVAQAALNRNAQLEAQLADLKATKTARGVVITLGDVLFGTNRANLTSDGVQTTQKLANLLKQYPQLNVLIEGYTDSTGTAVHNQELSEYRASSVRSALQDMGISRDRIASRGYGESYPVAGNDTMQSRQLNRRVEIVLSDENGKITQR